MNNKKNKSKLQRKLNPMHVWAIAFGCIIGWGSFVNPGKKFLPNSGVAGTAIAMILGAVVMIIIAYSYAYMVPKYPEAGGEFAFARNCFGKTAAYICGWFLVAAYLTNVPMNSTAIGLIVDGLDGTLDILKFGFHYSIAGFDVYFGEMIFAMFILIMFGILNILGVEKAGFVQTILSSLLVGSVLILTIATIFSQKTSLTNIYPIWGFDKNAFLSDSAAIGDINKYSHLGSSGIISSVLATFSITPWAYVGFDTIPQAAEEFNFSYKKVLFIMIIAIIFGCFVYISNNTISAICLTNWPERVINGEWVLLIAAEELLGIFGKALIGLAVSCAVLSGIMGFYLASSRLMYSMSKNGYLPKWFSKLNSKYGTPINSILFSMLISLVGPILGREALGWFVDMSAIGASIGYFFTCASTMIELKKDHNELKMLKILSLIGVIFSVGFIILQLIPIPGLEGVHFSKESYMMLLLWIIIGLLLYIINYKKIY